jgi:methionine synthase I (cobalamin-dependent)
MDVDKLRRINMLSSELKKHGMADSSQDAYTQAQEIIQVTPKQSSQATQESVIVETAPAQDPLAAKQFQIELDKMQRGFSEEMDVLRNAMNQLIIEVNSLRDELGKAQAAQPPKQKEKQVELKTETKVSHPRQGNWTPGDVDIQKMFYYGTKK